MFEFAIDLQHDDGSAFDEGDDGSAQQIDCGDGQERDRQNEARGGNRVRDAASARNAHHRAQGQGEED